MNEMIDIVDEDDNVIGQERRSVAKRNGMLYRSSAVIVRNGRGEFFVQKRASNKDLWPGMYAVGVGETLASGESYDIAAARGLLEETGITAALKPLSAAKYRSPTNNENIRIYICITEETPIFIDNEISEGFFVPEYKLKEMLKEKEFTPTSIVIMKKYWERTS